MNNLLNIPFFYNLRFLVAGNQRKTKEFVKNTVNKYTCRSIIDIGCGTGDFAPLFSPKEYTGIDINNRYIEFAKGKYPSHFICSNVVTYDFRGKKYDASIFISTLHHLSDKEIQTVFSKLIKVTTKIIIVVDLNPETSWLKKLLIQNDRGKFIRSTKEKEKLLSSFGKILEITHFSTGMASQSGIVLKPYANKK